MKGPLAVTKQRVIDSTLALVDQAIDTTTPAGRLLFNVLGSTRWGRTSLLRRGRSLAPRERRWNRSEGGLQTLVVPNEGHRIGHGFRERVGGAPLRVDEIKMHQDAGVPGLLCRGHRDFWLFANHPLRSGRHQVRYEDENASDVPAYLADRACSSQQLHS